MAHEMLWKQIHDEREALLADLENLTDEQWRTQSLCAEWTVQQVVAHMVGTATSTKLGFLTGIAKNKGNLEAHLNEAVAKFGSGTPGQTLAAYRETMHNRTAPPGPVQSWLGEAVVHGEDIRKPLGLKRDHPAETLRELGDFYRGSNLVIGAKKRIAGLQLMATDMQWSNGSGEIVRGEMLPLLMTMTGRAAYLDDLDGEGMLTYRARFSR